MSVEEFDKLDQRHEDKDPKITKDELDKLEEIHNAMKSLESNYEL